MREFEGLVTTRETKVDGVGPWYWLKTDSGAWDGPKSDWENHHSQQWFKHITNWTCCVQAGACQGMYPRLLAYKFSTVYSFEPDRLNHYVATLNNQSENVFIFNAAIGKQTGTFTGVKRGFMDNVGMHKTEGPGPVPIIALDSLCLPVLGLLALDIEGYEYEAIQGAVDTINRCSPVIVLERPGAPVKEILDKLGYREDCQSMADVVFVRK
jgi:FkbM family methyltransferase